MLGKRCRTLQRTASISQNMGPHYLHHNNYHHYTDLTANYAIANAENILISPSQATNLQVTAIIPQIIGFNPMIKGDQSPQSKAFRAPDHSSAQNTSSRPLPHDLYDDDPACANNHLQNKLAGGGTTAVPSKRSQITPRSALQTLLAAARQITYTDQSPTSKNDGSKSPLIKASAASPSCATSISAKQGLWQGFPVSESKTKEISTNQSLIKAAVITTETKAAPECYNYVNMSEAESDNNIFYVEGASNLVADHHIILESEKNRHAALYLATSPLAADFTPNLAVSMSFLESCYLCKRQLGQGRDIFIYRGESAFCSVECRDKQMRMEERKEKITCMQFKMNNNMQRQEFYNNANIVSSNGAPNHQHHKPYHIHHHQYSSQAYNNKQHCTSLLLPAA